MSILVESGESLLTEAGSSLSPESGDASLRGRATLQLIAHASLAGAAMGLRLQSRARVAGMATGRLQILRLLQALASQISLQARHGPPCAPKLRAQRLNDKIVASVYAHPAVIRLAWALDDAPLADASPTLLNPSGGQPLLLDLPVQPPQDNVLHRLTLQAWQSAMGRNSPRAAFVLDLKPNSKSSLNPPKSVKATQIRDWTPSYRDLTRIEWEWGDDEPGMAEVTAYIRPVGAANRSKREFKNLSLAIVDANSQSYLAESIGPKINWAGATRVYFGVARYAGGERSPELISNEIHITANVSESALETVFNPDVAAKHLTQVHLIYAISQRLVITTATTEAIISAALLKIKATIAKGGSVEISNVGRFDALWSDPILRVDRVTGKTTTTPPERRARFVPSTGFRVGVARSQVLTDSDVNE